VSINPSRQGVGISQLAWYEVRGGNSLRLVGEAATDHLGIDVDALARGLIDQEAAAAGDQLGPRQDRRRVQFMARESVRRPGSEALVQRAPGQGRRI